MTVYVLREGGLGNQLFQLAAAMGLDGRGDGRLLPPERKFLLDIEQLAPRLLVRIRRDDKQMVRATPPSLRYAQPVSELPGAFAPKPDFSRRPRLISGFFQHPDWYTAALPAVVEGLLAAAPRRLTPRPDAPPVVNVRGGDYAEFGWILPSPYYVSAAGVAGLDGAITIADDPERGAEIARALTAAGTAVAPPVPTAPIRDFWTLAAAPTVVMANSTFSWWAMQVGDELYRRAGLRRTVVFPKQWLLGEGAVLCAPGWHAV